jgi:hypothetical protein
MSTYKGAFTKNSNRQPREISRHTPRCDVAPINAGQTSLGPRVNHLWNIWDLSVLIHIIGTYLTAGKEL